MLTTNDWRNGISCKHSWTLNNISGHIHHSCVPMQCNLWDMNSVSILFNQTSCSVEWEDDTERWRMWRPILRYYSNNCLEELKSQESKPQCWESKLGPPKHEAGVLTAQLLYLVLEECKYTFSCKFSCLNELSSSRKCFTSAAAFMSSASTTALGWNSSIHSL